MNITKYRIRTKELTVDFGEGEVLHLTYYPNEVKLEDILEPESKTVREAAEELTRTVVAWDLEEDGVPVPITVEALSSLPIQFFLTVQRAIAEDLRPGETTGSN